MYTLIFLSAAVAVTFAATPFFESPHKEGIAAFYKTPSHHQQQHAPAPVHHAPAPAYRPHSAPAPAYRPHSAPAPSYSGHQPSYSSHGHGATSFQSVKLENGHQEYRPQHNSHY